MNLFFWEDNFHVGKLWQTSGRGVEDGMDGA